MNPFEALPALALAARDVQTTFNCMKALVILFIFLVPFYLFMRSLAKYTRIRYGFDTGPEDDGPPIRVCFNCNNTVLELDFAHCPYCGSVLETLETPGADASSKGSEDADVDADPEAQASDRGPLDTD